MINEPAPHLSSSGASVLVCDCKWLKTKLKSLSSSLSLCLSPYTSTACHIKPKPPPLHMLQEETFRYLGKKNQQPCFSFFLTLSSDSIKEQEVRRRKGRRRKARDYVVTRRLAPAMDGREMHSHTFSSCLTHTNRSLSQTPSFPDDMGNPHFSLNRTRHENVLACD